VAQPQPADLVQVPGDVLVGGLARVLPGLHRVLLGWQAERVEAHRVQDVPAGHPVVAGENVGADEAQRVPDVQAGAGRVREHVLHEQLVVRHVTGQRTDGVRRLERPVLRPVLLPPRLDGVGQRGRVAVCRHCLGGVTHRGVLPWLRCSEHKKPLCRRA
jgi:hypothetical protein